jgi:2-keto-4-pentenoate hydratase
MSLPPSRADATVAELAHELYCANASSTAIEPLSARASLSVGDAYDIQLRVVHMQVAEGRRVVGRKVGLTSRAMQEALGVDQPDFGHLFADRDLTDVARVAAGEFIAPRAEPEIGFRLRSDLRGPGIGFDDVHDAIGTVHAALEIIDSRIDGWRITLVDTVADNASFGAFVLGTPVDPADVDIERLEGRIVLNDQVVESGPATAVLGHPYHAVAWLANTLATYDAYLSAGDVVLPGSVTRAVPFAPGDEIRADFGPLGTAAIAVDLERA